MTEELGNYETSYFIINVPTKADLKIRDMSDEDFSIFFHEYIHFLQDITSFYGYMGIYSHGEYIRRAINDIRIGPKQFNAPLELKEKGDYVIINNKIATISLGDKGERNTVIINKVFIEEFQLADGFPIPELHVLAATDQGEDEIIIGAYAIRENMAYLLERKCTTKYKTSRDFPYKIVEILANKMCPNRLSDLDLIALCDISLQSSMPGHAIFLILEAIANGNMVVNKPEDFYDLIFCKKINFLGKEMEIRHALKDASRLATDHLLSYVRIIVLTQEYQEWINFTMQAGVMMRTQDPYFFLKMARSSNRNKENKVLQHIARSIGSPQMINELGKRFQLVTDRPICRFEYLEAVKEIEHLFESGERKCSLKSWCMMSPNGAPVDDRCDNAPWKRCNDEQLCPYGLLWKHWGLSGYEASI